MTETHDVPLPDGRTVRVHDSAPGDPRAPVFLWHHGSPQTGAPLEPIVAAAGRRGLRHLSYARPSYGGSTPQRGRSVADAAADVAAIADALGIQRLFTGGASGGGPHALACAAALGPERVAGVVTIASPAPYTEDFDWFAGMHAPGGLRAARDGRPARAAFAATEEFDEASFTARDWAALQATWAPLAQDAMLASTAGPDGLIDDDVAFAHPWGVDLAAVAAPVLVVQGGEDRMIPPAHAHRLLGLMPDVAELWLRPRDGHVSVLDAIPVALDWLLDAAAAAAV